MKLENYLVRKLPNGLVLIISPEKERKVLKPNEIGKYFEEAFSEAVEEWGNKLDSIEKIESKLEE